MINLLLASLLIQASAPKEPVVVSCKFDKLPLMILTFRDGMGAKNNTLQIGQNKPVPLSVGSSLMMAELHGQEFAFSLRLPASVSVTSQGSNTVTYHGDCVSTLSPES